MDDSLAYSTLMKSRQQTIEELGKLAIASKKEPQESLQFPAIIAQDTLASIIANLVTFPNRETDTLTVPWLHITPIDSLFAGMQNNLIIPESTFANKNSEEIKAILSTIPAWALLALFLL